MSPSPITRSQVFHFLPTEVEEMEALAQQVNGVIPPNYIFESLAEKFSTSHDRVGKIKVQPKQVKNWFLNRHYYDRPRIPMDVEEVGNMMPAAGFTLIDPLSITMHSGCSTNMDVQKTGNMMHVAGSTLMDPSSKTVHSGYSTTMDVKETRNMMPTAESTLMDPSFETVHNGCSLGRNSMEECLFEAKSTKDGSWYDIDIFLNHRFWETGDPEVKVHFSGSGIVEDEWVNLRQCVRRRSLPCGDTECVAVLHGDLVLCFKESKEQGLYFDARVLAVQRRRHDIRGCRCRFHIRYEHDKTEEIVPLRKVLRRPETNYRLQTSHASI